MKQEKGDLTLLLNGDCEPRGEERQGAMRLSRWGKKMMNSMVLTSGEVTGLSQDRVSKQDTVAGKHRSKCCDELVPQ